MSKHRTVIRNNMATYHRSVARGKARFLNWEKPGRARPRQVGGRQSSRPVSRTVRTKRDRKRRPRALGRNRRRSPRASSSTWPGATTSAKSSNRSRWSTEEIHLNEAFAAAGIRPWKPTSANTSASFAANRPTISHAGHASVQGRLHPASSTKNSARR